MGYVVLRKLLQALYIVDFAYKGICTTKKIGIWNMGKLDWWRMEGGFVGGALWVGGRSIVRSKT